jgi:hypothetical protein
LLAGVTAPILAVGALFLGQSSSWAWGQNADRIIVNKAVDSLPDEMRPFFQANRQFLVQHVADPEEASSATHSEDHNGFIRLDHYGAFPFAALPHAYNAAVSKFNRHTVETYGLLPWQIGIYSKELTDAFQSRDWTDVKLDAAALAYYVAAAHDPFNTTMDSTGAVAGQAGVSGRFGTGLVDRFQLFFFVKPNDAAFVRDPTEHAFDIAFGAHAWLESVFLADRRAHEGLASYGDDYYDRFYAQAGAILIRQFSDASTEVGSYWMTAWINSGRPQPPPQ